METHFAGISNKFRLAASLLYKDTCPELSRFLLQKCDDEPKKKTPHSLTHIPPACPHCHEWWKPNNHRIRLRPKPCPSARIQSVLRRRARNRRLSLMQAKLLRRFERSSSVLMATCHTCNKTTRLKGANREFITTLAKTHAIPGSASKYRTPQSNSRVPTATPKSTNKDKTPVNTPRSTSASTPGSASSSSSKSTPKSKHSIVQRLGKILMRGDHQGKKKGSLKDFLSSL